LNFFRGTINFFKRLIRNLPSIIRHTPAAGSSTYSFVCLSPAADSTDGERAARTFRCLFRALAHTSAAIRSGIARPASVPIEQKAISAVLLNNTQDRKQMTETDATGNFLVIKAKRAAF
jgi:hypothetical protein